MGIFDKIKGIFTQKDKLKPKQEKLIHPSSDLVEESPVEEAVEQPSVEQTPVEEVVEHPSVEESPVEEVVEQPSVEQTPVEEVVEHPSVEESPVEEVVEQPSVEESPVEEAVEQPSVEQTPVEEVVEQPSVEQTPVEEVVEQPSVEESPLEEVVEQPSVEEYPLEEVVEQPSVEESPLEEVVEQPSVEESPLEEVVEQPSVEESPLEEVVEQPSIEESPVEEVLINPSKSEKKKLDQTLDKTRSGLFQKMKFFFSGKNKVDAEFLDQLEEMLIVSDVGVPTTVKIIDLVEQYVAQHKYLNQEELKGILKMQIVDLLKVDKEKEIVSQSKPYVIVFVGVNGVGKTTTIAKLAHSFKKQGKKVLIGAADTFRAAAIEQLDSWAKKIDVPIVKQTIGSDPASVAYDTIQSGLASQSDYIIIDTAGRLHNKVSLMNELEKITKTISKLVPSAPHEVVLALDASTGQNALEQAKKFFQSTKVTHLALTKLDGTAKGGVVISICDQLSIPIKYIGVGEKLEDLQLFDRMQFVESLFQ